MGDQNERPDNPDYLPYYYVFDGKQICVARVHYTTSVDPRGFITPYEYRINGVPIMWDREHGHVHFTGIWKALNNHKSDIVRIVEANPGMDVVKIRGGFLQIQGTWIPYEAARILCRQTAFQFRNELTPLFGPHFSSECIPPTHPDFGCLQINPGVGRRAMATSVEARRQDYIANNGKYPPVIVEGREAVPVLYGGSNKAGPSRPLARPSAPKKKMAKASSSSRKENVYSTRKATKPSRKGKEPMGLIDHVAAAAKEIKGKSPRSRRRLGFQDEADKAPQGHRLMRSCRRTRSSVSCNSTSETPDDNMTLESATPSTSAASVDDAPCEASSSSVSSLTVASTSDQAAADALDSVASPDHESLELSDDSDVEIDNSPRQTCQRTYGFTAHAITRRATEFHIRSDPVIFGNLTYPAARPITSGPTISAVRSNSPGSPGSANPFRCASPEVPGGDDSNGYTATSSDMTDHAEEISTYSANSPLIAALEDVCTYSPRPDASMAMLSDVAVALAPDSGDPLAIRSLSVGHAHSNASAVCQGLTRSERLHRTPYRRSSASNTVVVRPGPRRLHSPSGNHTPFRVVQTSNADGNAKSQWNEAKAPTGLSFAAFYGHSLSPVHCQPHVSGPKLPPIRTSPASSEDVIDMISESDSASTTPYAESSSSPSDTAQVPQFSMDESSQDIANSIAAGITLQCISQDTSSRPLSLYQQQMVPRRVIVNNQEFTIHWG